MIRFNREERLLMMLYNPGTRAGLVEELQEMRRQLTSGERRLRKLTDRTLEKLADCSDEDFSTLDLYPEL